MKGIARTGHAAEDAGAALRRTAVDFGMPGGPGNPLGVCDPYLYVNGKDSLFCVHGTNEPDSIGRASSSGCIRMLNRHIEGIYEQTPLGTKVIVL